MADKSDKTEKPTPKRRKEARQRGQVARTPELGQWLSVLVLSTVLGPLVKHEIGAWRDFMVSCLQSAQSPDPTQAMQIAAAGARHAFTTIAVFGCMVLVVSVLAAVAQGGFFVATKAIKPDLSKLNLLKGLQSLLSVKTLWQGAKMLLKSALIALLCYGTIVSVMPLVGGLMPVQTVLDTVDSKVIGLMRNVALAALVLAAADYVITRRRTGKELMMTKHEVKEERRTAEGDPQVKGQIRSRQLANARNRMLADVATADVLLVNPTHIAIALRYDAERGAPRVIARGAGAIAARIRERAEAERIPTVHDVPLARALYRSCEVGQEIPRELFAAVAQVLAFVISRRRHGAYGGSHRTPRQEQELPAVPLAARRRGRAAAATAPASADPE
jgi:flagellar biosynthesis protein FlhB